MTQGKSHAGENTIVKGVIRTGKKDYMPPLPSTYKEKELSEDLNNGMDWMFRDYRRSLKQAKDPYHIGTM